MARMVELGPRRVLLPALDSLRQRPLPSCFVLVFVISWGGALLAITGAGAMAGTTPESDPRFVYALIAMLTGPSIVGLVLTGLVHGRAGLHELGSRTRHGASAWRGTPWRS